MKKEFGHALPSQIHALRKLCEGEVPSGHVYQVEVEEWRDITRRWLDRVDAGIPPNLRAEYRIFAAAGGVRFSRRDAVKEYARGKWGEQSRKGDLMSGNRNVIVTADWSDPASRRLYETRWPDEPHCRAAYDEGRQCGGCSFFAPFDADWGLCAHPRSRHRLETVFEHFTCPAQVPEGWGPHSFTSDPNSHCLCGGEADYWRPLVQASRALHDAEPDGAADPTHRAGSDSSADER